MRPDESSSGGAAPAAGSGLPGWLRRILAAAQSNPVRIAFAVLAVSLAGWALAREWTEVRSALAQMRPGLLIAAVAATLANSALTGVLWRTLLADLGSVLPLRVAARVFFVGQMGKYVPGSVWPVVMQAELARDHGVPRRRTAAATAVTMLLSLTTGLVVVIAALPFVPQVAGAGYGWTLLAVVPLLVSMHPRVLGPVLDRVIGAVGGQALERRPSAAGMARGTAWAIAAWLAAGAQLWLLIGAVGGEMNGRTLALGIGGYAFAWAVGMIVVVAPAGAGPREVVLLAALGSVVAGGAALVVVLCSRVLFTATDLIAAGVSYFAGPAHTIPGKVAEGVSADESSA